MPATHSIPRLAAAAGLAVAAAAGCTSRR